MRLNFSGSSEDEIREGIDRIGNVVAQQVELYESITGEHLTESALSPDPAAPGGDAEEAGGTSVIPFRRQAK